MKNTYLLLNDYERATIDYETFCDRVSHNEIVILNGSHAPVVIGKGLGLRINSSIGLNSANSFHSEAEKIQAIAQHTNVPDIMMDLSTVKISTPLYTEIQHTIGCPVGTIPYYVCFDSKRGIDDNELLETIEEQAANGVSFMTLHLTASLDLAEKSLTRNIPIISRGGSLLLRDLRINQRHENVILQNLEAVISILKKYNVAVSIGTTYRPSTQYDALDFVHRAEMQRQFEISDLLIQKGLRVMMEGIGHIAFHRIPEFCTLLRARSYIPFMPLGPIVSDHSQGQDHITSSVGATYLASLGGADIINAVTREEHTGGIPNANSILEAIDAAATVVKIINESRFPSHFCKSNMIYHNCMGTSDDIGCTRCSKECPFIWNEEALFADKNSLV